MAGDRCNRLLRYETWSIEYEMLARVAADRIRREHYEYLAAHYRYLAASFREVMVVHGAGLAKLTVH